MAKKQIVKLHPGLVASVQRKSPKVQARRLEVLKFRKAGLTQREIAAKLGVSNRTIETDLEAVFAELREERVIETKGLLDLELARLDSLLKPYYAKALLGNEFALGAALNVLDRRYKLLGLTRPMNINVEMQNLFVPFMEALGVELPPEVSAMVIPVMEKFVLEAGRVEN
jgi:DNA-binding CsgD family transcriptional regulator